jgi:hypothetical protein
MVASADFIVPLMAALFLDAASPTSEKSCFLCFSVKQVHVFFWQLLSVQFVRVKYVTVILGTNIVQIVNNTFAAIVSCLI